MSSLKVYLDTSVYNRPFDDQTQPRIWLETMATSLLLEMIESAMVELVVSSVVEYENSRNPFPLRQRWVNRCMSLAKSYQRVDEDIRQRATELERLGLKAIDALRLACAEASGSDYLITCDDQVIRRCPSLSGLRVLGPVDFILMMSGGLS